MAAEAPWPGRPTAMTAPIRPNTAIAAGPTITARPPNPIATPASFAADSRSVPAARAIRAVQNGVRPLLTAARPMPIAACP